LVPNLPLGLHRIVQRCIEKGPEQRFHSAADLAFALESAADSSLSGQRSIVAAPPPSRKTWLIPASLLMFVVLVAFFWLWPKIHPHRLMAGPSLEESSRDTVVQPADLKGISPQSANPHELSIQDATAFTWFDPRSRQALVWYSPSADGSFRYFDGPGVDPQTGRSFKPVTPEFVGNLKRGRAPEPIVQKQEARVAVSSKSKETPVGNSPADSLGNNAQLEDLVQQARSAVNAKDYRTALGRCTKVLTVTAGSQPCTAIRQHASIKLAEQLVNEGTAHLEKGEFDKALRSAEQALDLDPANQDAAKLKRLALQMKPHASK